MNPICIRCGKASDEALIGVDVQTGEIHCGECDETYAVDDVEAVLSSWAALLPWLKAHPARQPQCGQPGRKAV